MGFNVPLGENGQPKAGSLELWYPGTDAYAVSVTGPGCPTTGVVLAGSSGGVDTPCGRVEITSTAPQPNNDDRQIRIDIGSTTTAPLVSGAWTLTLTGTTVAGGSHPFSIISGQDANDLTFTHAHGAGDDGRS